MMLIFIGGDFLNDPSLSSDYYRYDKRHYSSRPQSYRPFWDIHVTFSKKSYGATIFHIKDNVATVRCIIYRSPFSFIEHIKLARFGHSHPDEKYAVEIVYAHRISPQELTLFTLYRDVVCLGRCGELLPLLSKSFHFQ